MKIIEKPWGREEVIEINEKYMMNEQIRIQNYPCKISKFEVNYYIKIKTV